MENVWQYPRLPAVTPCERRVRVVCADHVLADSAAALRVLECGRPPEIYIPASDVRMNLLTGNPYRRRCQWKGIAHYYDVLGRAVAAWAFPDPTPGFAELAGHVAFDPSRMDGCWLGRELVQAFPAGWLTADVSGARTAPGPLR